MRPGIKHRTPITSHNLPIGSATPAGPWPKGIRETPSSEAGAELRICGVRARRAARPDVAPITPGYAQVSYQPDQSA